MGSKSPSSTTSTQRLDPTLTRMYNENYAIAKDFLNEGFTPYEGERIAGLNTDQLNTMDFIRSQYDDLSGRGYRDRLDGLINTDPTAISAGTFDPNTFRETYVDPFYNDDLVNDIMSGVRTDIGRQVATGQQSERDKAIAVNAFGNNRLGLQEGVVQARGDEALASTSAQLRQNMMNQANKFGTDLFKSDMKNQLTGDLYTANIANELLGNQLKYAYLGGQDQSSALNQLSQVGDALQSQDQAVLDQLYSDFRAPEADFYNRFNLLNSVANSVPVTSSTTSTQSGGSRAAGVLGGALGGAGMASMFGGGAPLALSNPLTAALVIGGGLLGGL